MRTLRTTALFLRDSREVVREASADSDRIRGVEVNGVVMNLRPMRPEENRNRDRYRWMFVMQDQDGREWVPE